MFLNTFHSKHIFLELKIKKLLRKISSKNLTAGVYICFIFIILEKDCPATVTRNVSLRVFEVVKRLNSLTYSAKVNDH